MKTVTVKVNSDHLRTLSTAKKPILSVAELIWNSLDADTLNVTIELIDNALGALERIKVSDDGHGLNYEDAIVDFGNLGGSWKRTHGRSKNCGRLLHGRLGKGRFRAFGLGHRVTWITRFLQNGKTKEYSIVGKAEDPTHFVLSDPIDSNIDPGTEVLIENIQKNFTSLRGDNAIHEIALHFALYLRQYPDVSIKYDGHEITTKHLESRISDFHIKGTLKQDGTPIEASLTIIEWKQQADRSLYLCDSGGFTLLEIPIGIHARGFDFTAYLKSDYFRELHEEGLLELEELQPQIKQLIDSSKNLLRDHFRKRAADEALSLVRTWKEEQIYPYKGDPRNLIEEAERQVFDVCALNIHSYLPEFEHADHKSRNLAFKLLKNALETNPSAIQTILTEVLGLPKKKQEEFANLLRQTSLTAIISASKIVTDRLTFIRGLELLLFDPDSKKQLLERRQLHRILAENSWVFGEEFHLTLDDESITELLKKHRNSLGEDIDIVDEVRGEDGSKLIVDLLLGRRIPTARTEDREHLIVELKRPNFKLNDDSLTQIKKYAFAIAEDERFIGIDTKWTFWLISNDMNSSVYRQANQRHLPPGCIHDDAEKNIKIWVKTWGQVLAESQSRLHFFQEQLQYRAKREDALSYLRKEYKKYLPEVFQTSDKVEEEDVQSTAIANE